MAIFDRNPPPDREEDLKVEKIIRRDGVTKPDNKRVLNLHDWGDVQEREDYYGVGISSGILYQSGESMFQDFTDDVTSPAVVKPHTQWTNTANNYAGNELLKDSGIVSPATDTFSTFTEQPSILEHSGINSTSSQFSNAVESRNEASGLGLYNVSTFNPYIHYDGGQKINYSENYKVANKYLDPYSDQYIFQTDISSTVYQSPEEDTNQSNNGTTVTEGSPGTQTVLGKVSPGAGG